MKNEGGKRTSFIVGGVRAFALWFASLFANGFLGTFFTTYTSHNRALKQSFLKSNIGGKSKIAGAVRKLRFHIADQFDNSRFLYLIKRVKRFLLGCRMRFYGSFTVTFGIYTGLTYLVKRFAFEGDMSDPVYLSYALFFVLISIPMLASKKSFAQSLTESRAGHFIVTNILGIPDEVLSVRPSRLGANYNISIIAGLVFGAATYFVSPWQLCVFVIVPVAVSLVLAYPEIGVLFSLIILPFVGLTSVAEEVLIGAVCVFLLAYFIKLICGRRTVKVGIFEMLLLVFGVFVFFCGRISLGGQYSAASADKMLILILGGFVALNLMRTEKWIRRCGIAVMYSSMLTGALIIWQFVAEHTEGIRGLELLVFNRGELPFFGSSDALAAYLIIACVLTVSLLPTLNFARAKLVALVCVTMNVCAIFTLGSISGIIGILAAALLYMIIVSKRAPIVIMLLAFAGVYAFFMVPQYFGEFTAMVARAGETLGESVAVWHGGMRMIVASLFGGIGVNAFSTVYPAYAVAGSEYAVQSSSLLIRLLCDVGLVGTLIFAGIILLFAKNCFEHLTEDTDKSARLITVGGICAVFGLLVQSVFFDIWSDYSIFYMFWMVMSMTCAGISTRRSDMERQRSIAANNESAAFIEIVTDAERMRG